MKDLAPLIDLYCDEQLMPYLVSKLDAHKRKAGELPQMAQLQGLYRRAQGVRHAEDLFLNQKGQVNTGSFEAWLQHRIQLAQRRGSFNDLKINQSFFELVKDLLFGQDIHSIRRASNGRLAEFQAEQPSPELRAQAQLQIFRRWMDCFCSRARFLINQQPRHRGNA